VAHVVVARPEQPDRHPDRLADLRRLDRGLAEQVRPNAPPANGMCSVMFASATPVAAAICPA
jgi:hypothetical protein